jgi:F0F1-type ATP synthase epsilon subunit
MVVGWIVALAPIVFAQAATFAVGEGLVEVTNTRISIATNMAIEAEKIDAAAVEEARQRAAARLQESCRRKTLPR